MITLSVNTLSVLQGKENSRPVNNPYPGICSTSKLQPTIKNIMCMINLDVHYYCHTIYPDSQRLRSCILLDVCICVVCS